MAVLSNPVNNVNIVSRFHDYVRASAQSGVTWGSNNLPVYAPGTPYAYTVIPSGAMGGPTNGDPGAAAFIGDAAVGSVIDSTNIFNYLIFYTYEYVKIRSIRALLTVSGQGGNTGTRPTAGEVYDVTRVAYVSFAATNGQPQLAEYVTPARGGLNPDQVIDAVGMENFLARCRSAYTAYSRNQTYIYNPVVCHASCHSACHGSRGRR
jgi:hypothetical protein